jgi:hypothetical protein
VKLANLLYNSTGFWIDRYHEKDFVDVIGFIRITNREMLVCTL